MGYFIAWCATTVVAVLVLILGTDSLRLFAIPFLAVAVLRLAGDRPRRLWARLPFWAREGSGPVLLVGLCAVFYAPLLAGNFPVNHDHPVFLLQAWVTGNQLMPSGALTGFSPTLFAGYPANALYPLGTSLLVSAIHFLSLGLLSWETSYCWALVLAVLAYPLALYAIGRRALGPLAGVVAGFLGIIDRGAWFQSGWDFNLNWGVWSMGLSFSLCLWSLWAVDRLARSPGRFTILGAAAAIAGAVLCHPMAVALMGISLPLYLAVLMLLGRLPAPGLWLPRVTAAGVLGAGLTLFWLLPFMKHQDWFEPLAAAWRPFEDVVHGLLDGNLLNAFSPVLMFSGFIGLLLYARRGQPMASFLLLASGLLLFFSSNTFLLTFDVLKKFPSFSNLQLERFAYLIRSALLLGVGFLAEAMLGFRASAGEPARFVGPTWRHLHRYLWALAAAPLLLYGIKVGSFPNFAPAKPLTWSSESEPYHDLREAASYLNAQDRARLGRIAVVAVTHEHLLLSLPVYTGLPIFKVGFTPEDNYRFKFESRDPAVWKVLNVSHVLSIGPLMMPELEEEHRFGQLYLYRFRDFSRQRLSLTGPGQAEMLRDNPEAIDIRISGAAPGSRLTLYTARYALWRAEMNGISAPISGAAVGDSPEVFMELPVSNGLLTMRYRAGAVEWAGGVLSWLSVLAVFLFSAAQLWPHLNEKLRRIFAPFTTTICDITTLGVLAAVVLGLLLLIARLLLPAPSPFPGRAVVADLAQRLPKARGEVVQAAHTSPCQPFDGHKIQCPGPDWNFAGEVILGADHLMHQCIWLHPIQGAKFTLHFDNVPLGEAVQGFFGMDDGVVEPPSDMDVKLTVALDSVALKTFSCPSRRGWFGWEVATPGRKGATGRITIQSEAAFTGRRHFCFTAATTIPAE